MTYRQSTFWCITMYWSTVKIILSSVVQGSRVQSSVWSLTGYILALSAMTSNIIRKGAIETNPTVLKFLIPSRIFNKWRAFALLMPFDEQLNDYQRIHIIYWFLFRQDKTISLHNHMFKYRSYSKIKVILEFCRIIKSLWLMILFKLFLAQIITNHLSDLIS